MENMEKYGKIWKNMKKYEKKWKNMKPYGKNMGKIWKTMEKIWKNMENMERINFFHHDLVPPYPQVMKLNNIFYVYVKK